MRFVLASTSPARAATLAMAGIAAESMAPEVDEDLVGAGIVDPTELVATLARAKAEAVARGLDPGLPALVLGGDSVFEFDGVVYGKPHLPDVARERWRAMRGGTGTLHSGHWLIDTAAGHGIGRVSSARLSFADDITDDEIDDYVATGEPLEVAGAFTIEGRGSAFITEVDGDPHAIRGLSVATVRQLVRDLGHPWRVVPTLAPPAT